jgi:hypothetical protein
MYLHKLFWTRDGRFNVLPELLHVGFVLPA